MEEDHFEKRYIKLLIKIKIIIKKETSAEKKNKTNKSYQKQIKLLFFPL